MKVFLGITCYDHKIYGECSESILKNSTELMKNGHVVVPYYSNDLYIDRSRNMIVNLFLDSDCTDLVFVDSDLSFDGDAILKLLKYDKDIVAGAYPYKKSFLEFPVTLKFDYQNNCKEEETGLVRAWRIPTGLMRIQRRVFDEIDVKEDERGIKQFFETGMRFDDPNWFGEDTFFCAKCKEYGIDLWIEPRLNFSHYGLMEFKGNYHEYLMGRRADLLDKNADGLNGWTTPNELEVLKFLASMSHSVAEIGSWKGRSTKAILESCNGIVYAIDHWLGSKDDETGLIINDTVYEEFMENTKNYSTLKILKGNSSDMKNSIGMVDMVFVDGDHSYEGCKSDIENYLPKCKKFICGHDYNFPEVKKAVDEKFGTVNVVDTLWFKKLI